LKKFSPKPAGVRIEKMSKIVDIFEYAMQMEKDGENYYHQLAQQTTNKGLQAILIMLADEEVKHYNAIEKIKTAASAITETTILTDAKNVFVQIRQSGESFNFDLGQIELYKKAQDIEEKSRVFYLEKSGHVEEGYQRDLFLRLAEEEKRHYFLLDNIIEFVSRPERWLENAEFCHLEEY
jgi:rubrerythrin